jgi:hypothetical protein
VKGREQETARRRKVDPWKISGRIGNKIEGSVGNRPIVQPWTEASAKKVTECREDLQREFRAIFGTKNICLIWGRERGSIYELSWDLATNTRCTSGTMEPRFGHARAINLRRRI